LPNIVDNCGTRHYLENFMQKFLIYGLIWLDIIEKEDLWRLHLLI